MSAHLPIANHLTPFLLESGHVRGRVVRLGDVSHTILTRYDYPPAVANMLGELLLVAAMLAANLKQEGIFTLQLRGKGLVPLVVVDAVYGGALRGYAEVAPDATAAIMALENPSPRTLVGEDAYLAITLDPGLAGERYQGVVALEGDTIAQAMMQYFIHSEQRDIEIMLTVGDAPARLAAGMMVERLPQVSSATSEENREAWRYALAMLATVKPEELLDPLLDAPALLYRLFHEEGVRVYDAHPLSIGCRCSRARIEELLNSMSLTDRADMLVDGVASVHCQFCNKAEIFTPSELGLAGMQ